MNVPYVHGGRNKSAGTIKCRYVPSSDGRCSGSTDGCRVKDGNSATTAAFFSLFQQVKGGRKTRQSSSHNGNVLWSWRWYWYWCWYLSLIIIGANTGMKTAADTVELLVEKRKTSTKASMPEYRNETTATPLHRSCPSQC
jgi:hypothetical protein